MSTQIKSEPARLYRFNRSERKKEWRASSCGLTFNQCSLHTPKIVECLNDLQNFKTNFCRVLHCHVQ